MSVTDEFSQPATGGSGVKVTDFVGRLLLFSPTEYVAEIATTFGTKDAVSTSFVVLDGPDAGTEHVGVLIFQGALIGALKQKIGGKVLGRLTRGVAKPGQAAPFILEAFTDADAAVARQHLAKNAPPPF